MGLSLLAVQGNLHECFGTTSRGGLFVTTRKLLKNKNMVDTILAVAIPIITIVIVVWAIMNFTWYFYDLPVKKIRQIAERNGKNDPYNWVFVTWFLSWAGVLLYWVINEKNKGKK